MSKDKPVILWFRQDLRLSDNPALRAAHETGAPILPVYILDEDNAGDRAMGSASKWWLHHSLKALNNSLNNTLGFYTGDAHKILKKLVRETGAYKIFWNRCYEPWRIERDKKIKRDFPDDGIEVESFNGALLFEPHTARKDDGNPYKVFTPFYKSGCLGNGRQPREPERKPTTPDFKKAPDSLALDDLGLMPKIKWYDGLDKTWEPGEDGAEKRLRNFLNSHIEGYKEGRDFPARDHSSHLSPHLHFGEISPNKVWHAARQTFTAEGWESDGETFLRELGWREFCYNLLYHFPDLPEKNLQEKFNEFPWRNDKAALQKWQRGQTGYPIVDAGMRQLWQTGYMHNRVRMITASFLVKNLMMHWHHGERWFWDTLVDADLANNAGNWQWVAGSGADAAPYFRIFNPVTQSEKFDPDGTYLREYVPELKNMPDKYIHKPWEANDEILEQAGVKLGKDYPEPMVDLKETRERALNAYKSIK